MSEANAAPATPEAIETPEQAASSLQAGFDRVRGNTPTESQPAEEATPPAEEAKEEEAPAPEAEAVIPGLGLTPTQVKEQLAAGASAREALEHSERKIFGKMGAMKAEILKSIQEAAPKGEVPAKIDKQSLKKITELYGEEMADAIASDLGSLIAAPAATVDAEAISKQVSETVEAQVAKRIADESRKIEVRFLTRAHPDWQTVHASPDFRVWEQTLPPEERQQLRSSSDAEFLIERFDAFKSWRDKSDPAKANTAKRLERAVSPTSAPSSGPAVLPDKVGLSVGFNRVRGKPA